MSDETLSDGDRISCPWCGEIFGDLWDYGDTERGAEIDCPSCGKAVLLTSYTSVSYTARRVEVREIGGEA